MDAAELKRIIAQGEGLSVEFKRCGNQPGRDVFETVCSFANRQGGTLLLGVQDDGTVAGVPAQASLAIQRNIVNTVSDRNLFPVAPLIEVGQVEVDGAVVVHVWVPMGPAVYSFRGVVYDRIADADVKVEGVTQVSLMYLRKQNLYSEQRVYRYATRDDLRDDLIDRARRLATSRFPQHPWGALDNDELLRSAGLQRRDRQTGDSGYTLAGILLFGTDEAIQDVCPAYKTDAIVRRDDADRYDDRLVVTTNLLDAYDLLIDFCRKNLPDRFVAERGSRVSARDIIVRELVANSLMHREYVSPYPAKIVIGPDGIRTENASRCLYEGRLELSSFNPMPKNPSIAKVFSALGWAEELGSGFRNLQRYTRLYSGGEPILVDGDTFSAFVPTVPCVSASGERGVAAVIEMLLNRDGTVSSGGVAAAAGVTVRTAQRHIRKMVEAGALVPMPEGVGGGYRRP